MLLLDEDVAAADPARDGVASPTPLPLPPSVQATSLHRAHEAEAQASVRIQSAQRRRQSAATAKRLRAGRQATLSQASAASPSQRRKSSKKAPFASAQTTTTTHPQARRRQRPQRETQADSPTSSRTEKQRRMERGLASRTVQRRYRERSAAQQSQRNSHAAIIQSCWRGGSDRRRAKDLQIVCEASESSAGVKALRAVDAERLLRLVEQAQAPCPVANRMTAGDRLDKSTPLANLRRPSHKRHPKRTRFGASSLTAPSGTRTPPRQGTVDGEHCGSSPSDESLDCGETRV